MLYIIKTRENITRTSFFTILRRGIESPDIRTWLYHPVSNRFIYRAVSWRNYGSISIEPYGKDINKLKIVFYPNNVASFTTEDLEYARAVFLADFTQMLLIHFSDKISRLSIYP